MTDKALTLIQKYSPKEHNVLMPVTEVIALNDWHSVTVELVQINPLTTGGEVYKPKGSREFAIRKPGLLKLANAAGISWNYRESGRVDDGSNPDIVRYKAVGAVRKPTGEPLVVHNTYEMDLRDIEAELQFNYEEKKRFDKEGKYPREVEYYVRRDMLQIRKYKNELAETKAMMRVIRSILTIKPTYTQEELHRPFVVPRVDFTPHLSNDPAVKQAARLAAAGAIRKLYGSEEDDTLSTSQPSDRVHVLANGNQASEALEALDGFDDDEGEALEIVDGEVDDLLDVSLVDVEFDNEAEGETGEVTEVEEAKPKIEKPKLGERPWSPSDVRAALLHNADQKRHKDGVAPAGQKMNGTMVGYLNMLFDNDDGRKAFLSFVFEAKSSKDLDKAAVQTTLDWINNSGDGFPANVVKEANAIKSMLEIGKMSDEEIEIKPVDDGEVSIGF